MDKMDKTYDPSFEKRIYDFWLKGRYFEAHPNDEKEPFTIMMPHPERVVRTISNSYHPDNMGDFSPWMRLFRNARRNLG